MRFIVSDEKSPSVQLRPGMKLDVQSVRLVDAQLRPVKTIGARLCSGGGTCIALVEVGATAARSGSAGKSRRTSG